jgi:hypothetical protein
MNRRGSAYIFVLAAALLIVLLVTAALTVSIVSRRVTSYYPDFFSLYDLAATGNEQAFLYLYESMEAQERTMAQLQSVVAAAFPRQWETTVNITPGNTPAFSETYRFTTTVAAVVPPDNRFRVQTSVQRVTEDLTAPATVQAYILLDGFALTMVQSRRIVI